MNVQHAEIVEAGGADPFRRIGVEPFINCAGVRTIYGGTLMPEAAINDMIAAAGYFVSMEELMEAASRRLAELTGAEAGIVTCGAAAALCVSAAAAIAGCDPEKMLRLPKPEGMNAKIIMLSTGRFTYDHALRMVGTHVVEIDSREALQRELGSDACLIAVLAAADARAPVRLEEIVAAARERGVPVLVDAAGEILVRPNPWLARGANLVAYSGGKYLRGPQTAGLLLGEERWIKAAWLHSAPHHTFGRPLKVGKEQIIAMLAALEYWAAERDVQEERKVWLRDLECTSGEIVAIAGIHTAVAKPAGRGDLVPKLEISWNLDQIPITAAELRKVMLDGRPRIMLDDRGSTESSFLIHPFSIQPGEAAIIGRQLALTFRRAMEHPPENTTPVGPAARLSGTWDVEIAFTVGAGRHSFEIDASGASGWHKTLYGRNPLKADAAGPNVTITSLHPFEGTNLAYKFIGCMQDDQAGMAGEVELGSTGQAAIGPINMKEYGSARWTATKRSED